MKKLLLIILFFLSINLHGQTMEKEYLIHLLDSQEVVNKKYDLFPQALKVLVKRKRVIVIFDRSDWERMRLISRERMKRRYKRYEPI